jgi:hypothetical protein
MLLLGVSETPNIRKLVNANMTSGEDMVAMVHETAVKKIHGCPTPTSKKWPLSMLLLSN